MSSITISTPHSTMKTFYDKHGVEIKAGDILRHDFFARMRERPGHKSVAMNGFGEDVILPDEGILLGAQSHWVTYKVEWRGACLIADRYECSDFNVLLNAELFDENNKHIYEGDTLHYFNNIFDSTLYEIDKVK
jgi:hypothetical protein